MSLRTRLLQRIGQRVVELDLGVSSVQLRRDPQRVLNQALSLIGAPRVHSTQNIGELRRAALALEAAGGAE